MTTSLHLQGLVEACGIGISSLGQEVSEGEYWNISRYLSQWRLIAPQLNITEPEVEAIERNYLTEEERRDGFLKKWKQKESFLATYRKLVVALLGIERAEDARCVCNLLKEKATAVAVDNLAVPDKTLQASDKVLQLNSHFNLLYVTLCNSIAPRWEHFGTYLGVKQTTMERIKAERDKDIQGCFRELIKEWLRQANPLATKSKIIEVLRELDFNIEANELENKL